MSSPTTKAQPSNFVWYELHTSDASAAQAFYNAVLGWTTQDSGMSDRSYTMIHAGKIPIGGILQKSDVTKAAWLGYLGVEDVDASVKRILQADGVVHHAAEDIPHVGRFAVVADPQGALFVLFQPANRDQQPELPARGTPGSSAWHELSTLNGESAFAFYADMFGWSKSREMDMGPNGVYQIFAAGADPIGGMMTRMDPAQNPAWLFYFAVDEINAAIARVKQHGGTIIHGPVVVPEGDQIAVCLDTQGAAFGMVGPKA